MDHDAVTAPCQYAHKLAFLVGQAHELFPTTAQTGLAAWTVPVTILGLDITPHCCVDQHNGYYTKYLVCEEMQRAGYKKAQFYNILQDYHEEGPAA